MLKINELVASGESYGIKRNKRSSFYESVNLTTGLKLADLEYNSFLLSDFINSKAVGEAEIKKENILVKIWNAIKKFFQMIWGKIVEFKNKIVAWLKKLFIKKKAQEEEKKEETKGEAFGLTYNKERIDEAIADYKEGVGKTRDKATRQMTNPRSYGTKHVTPEIASQVFKKYSLDEIITGSDIIKTVRDVNRNMDYLSEAIETCGKLLDAGKEPSEAETSKIIKIITMSKDSIEEHNEKINDVENKVMDRKKSIKNELGGLYTPPVGTWSGVDESFFKYIELSFERNNKIKHIVKLIEKINVNRMSFFKSGSVYDKIFREIYRLKTKLTTNFYNSGNIMIRYVLDFASSNDAKRVLDIIEKYN